MAVDQDIEFYYEDSKQNLVNKKISLMEIDIVRLDNEYIYNMEPVELNVPCETAEQDSTLMSNELTLIQRSRDRTWKKLIASGGIGLSPAALSFVGYAFASAFGDTFPPPQENAQVTNISDQKKTKGHLLSYSLSAFSENSGFNFAPKRNIMESVFWNASASSLLLYNHAGFTRNFNKSHMKGSCGATFYDTFGVNVGYLSMKYKETRSAQLPNGELISEGFTTAENGYFLSASLLVHDLLPNTLALAVTGKRINQNLDKPGTGVAIDENDGSLRDWKHDKEYRTAYDYDLSATYKLSNSITLGGSFLNVSGITLSDGTGREILQRMGGFGVVYQWKKVQFGTDIIFRESDNAEIAFGVNVMPYNYVEIQAGYDTTYQGFVLRTQLGFMSYSFNYSELFGRSHTLGFNARF